MSGLPKNKVKLCLLTILSLAYFSRAQQRISNISLYPTNTSVVIKFSIQPGSSCSGFTVLHSLDSLSYNEIASEPGICGASATAEEKSFTHFNPAFDQLNYYKIRLEPRVEISSAKNVFVSSSIQKGMLVYPNPHYNSDKVLSLKISEAENSKLKGSIFNCSGKEIKKLEVVTVGNEAQIAISDLENGFYTICLKNEMKLFTCKLIILH